MGPSLAVAAYNMFSHFAPASLHSLSLRFDVLRGVRSRFTVRQLLFLVEHVFEGLILLHGPWFSIFTSHKASAHYTLEPAEQP